uniref:Uncharacterized protein n=1 Tax=Glossina austeni TaxID=7395 RepID=A0A1A9VNW2_GLOAU
MAFMPTERGRKKSRINSPVCPYCYLNLLLTIALLSRRQRRRIREAKTRDDFGFSQILRSSGEEVPAVAHLRCGRLVSASVWQVGDRACPSPSIGGVSYWGSVIFPISECRIVGRWSLGPSTLYLWLSDVENLDRWPGSCCDVGVVLVSGIAPSGLMRFCCVWTLTTVGVVCVNVGDVIITSDDSECDSSTDNERVSISRNSNLFL